MSVAIVTDSAAALPTALIDRYAIGVVPLQLIVDGAAYDEGDHPPDALEGTHTVTTSGPPPGRFTEAIAARAGADGVVVLTIAASMSSTHESAVLGAKGAPVPVRVIDTGTAAGAEALVVLAAAEAAEAGEGIEGVEAAARRAMAQAHLVATVPSLDHLVRSGRVPEIAGRAGNRLGVAPLFEFRDGRARPLRPAFSRGSAVDRMLQRMRRSRVAGARLHVAAMHADAEEEARALLDRAVAVAAPVTAFVGEFNAVMRAHTGPGLLGLAWRWEAAPPSP
jgi:DegV family protein with EDD domain